MNAPTASTTPSLAKPRRRLWWWLLVLPPLVLLAVLVLTCVYIYVDYTTRAAWADAEAEADQLDPRWRLADIEADRAKVPDAENSALHVMATANKAPKLCVPETWCYNLIFEKLTPTAEMNEDQVNLLRAELAKIPEPLADARKLKDMPRGRFPIRYGDDFLSTSVADQQKTRTLIDWLKHDAMLLAHEKEADRAVESCRAIVNVGRSLGDEPLLISVLIRYASHATAAETLERVLAQGEASDEQLRLMQSLLQLEIGNAHFLQGLRGERGGNRRVYDSLRAGRFTLEDIAGTAANRRGHRSPGDWLADTRLLADFPEYLHAMNDIVEVVKLPTHERHAPLRDWDEETRGTKNIAIGLLCPSLVKIHEADCRSQGLVCSAVAALACERYRRRHGAWPATLDELVAKKLLNVPPADPMDNRPLRYRRAEDGIVIYSIGIDMTDNRGNIDHARPNLPGVDYGFRLWNVDRRRQPPPPRVEIPEKKE